MSIRVFATDIDGTLLVTGNPPTPPVLDALSEAKDAGLKIVVVTARPPRWVPEVAQNLPMADGIICGNGAIVLAGEQWDIDQSFSLDQDVIGEVVAKAVDLWPSVMVKSETTAGPIPDVPDEQRRWISADDDDAMDEVLGAGDTIKLLLHAEGENPDEMVAQIRERFGDAIEPSHSNIRGNMIEIAAQGITKASTLASLTATWGFEAEQVAAAGDMPNDIPMLRWAGRSYAMGNAHPDVMKTASLTVDSVEEDGLVQAIKDALRY